jgi:hypothetical protein
MKPYGIPRVPGNGLGDYPDILDIQEFARKSVVGRKLPEDAAGGEYKSYTRSSRKRRETRRIWKKKERQRIRRNLHAKEKNRDDSETIQSTVPRNPGD